MSVQKRNGKWGYDFRYEGKRYRKHRWSTKREATEIEVKLKADLNKGIDITNEISLSEYYSKWIEVNKSHVAERTMNNNKNVLIWIDEYFGSKRIKDITKMQYQAFINWYGTEAINKHDNKTVGHSKEAVKKLNGLIRSCVTDAVHEGIAIRDFTYKVKLNYSVQSKDEKLKYLELDELKKLKNALSGFENLTCLFGYIMLITGGRYSDCVRLEYSHLNEVQSTIFLNGSKNDTAPRTVSIPRNDMKLIMNFINSKPRNMNGYVFQSRTSLLTIEAVNKNLKNYCKALEIKPITSHALRHTHASLLIYNGVDIQYISKRLGHKNIQTTLDTYAHFFEVAYEQAENKTLDVLTTL